MIGEQFYPTPKEVIIKMLAPYVKERHVGGINGYQAKKIDLENLHILEPSAGKGDILDYIYEEYRYDGRKPTLYAIEIDPNLRHILQDKGYNVIGTDFLDYSNDLYFDLILMNPPFHNGVDHLLKAWETIHTGDIICLLNSETLTNQYTDKRKLLGNLIDKYGSIEFLGKCFTDAERRTDVDVTLVRLHKETKSKFDFSFCSITKEGLPDLDEEVVKEQGLMLNDIVGNFLLQYDNTKNAFVNFMKAKAGLVFYSQELLTNYTDIIEMANSVGYNGADSYNSFANKVRSCAWRKILYKLNIEKYMTDKVSQDFNKFIQHQGCMDLTKENIFEVLQFIIDNRENIMQNAIENVFDIFTQYHSENRCHVEGWKTNESWKVNKKIIMPYWVKYGSYMDASSLKEYGDTFSTEYRGEYTDIDKVMCHITGNDLNRILTIHAALEYHFKSVVGKVRTGDKFQNTLSSTFFNIKFFKKGTVHLEFRDEDLWKEFNRRACISKKWMPDDTRPSSRRKSTGVATEADVKAMVNEEMQHELIFD